MKSFRQTSKPVKANNDYEIITCPPESLDTGDTASDITGSGTFIEVSVYLTDPSVKVSPGEMYERVYESKKPR